MINCNNIIIIFFTYKEIKYSNQIKEILSFVVQETQSLNRCDLVVQISALAACRCGMCNQKFFILITVELAWYTIGISHSFYSHHVRLIVSVALTYVLKGCFTSNRVGVIISSIELYDLVKNSILIPLMTPCLPSSEN